MLLLGVGSVSIDSNKYSPPYNNCGMSVHVCIRNELLILIPLSTLISKSSSDGQERNYALTLCETNITFDYLPQNLDTSSLAPGSQRYRTVVVSGLILDPNFWHHVTLTVFAEDAVFYINGSVVSVQALEGSVRDNPTRNVLLGQLFTCELNAINYLHVDFKIGINLFIHCDVICVLYVAVGSFNGLMQDVSFYGQALTTRYVL